MTTLHIKNMVCPRCIRVVSEELAAIGLEIQEVQLGKVELQHPVSEQQLHEIKAVLQKSGFELLDDKKHKIIEQIKLLIIEGIRENKWVESKLNISHYISDALNMEYTNLSSLFSSVEGKSIERYVILQKIERIKELISYDEMSIKQIAEQMGYSSLQALSSQFKKETGLTPTEFKKMMDVNRRKAISDI